MIYSRNKPPKWWPQNENAPYHHDAIGGTEKLTNTSADFTGSRAQHGNIFAPMPGKHALNFELVLVCCAGACAGNFSRTSKSCGTIRPKAKAPACRNVKGKAVASPTDKRGFVMPKISRNGFARTGMVCVHGVAYPQGWPHGFTHVTKRHAHSLPVVRQPVVLKSRKGAKTMHPVNPLGHSAPTTPTLGKPSTSTTEAQAFALLEATSSASLAAFYLRKGNVAAARRKAVQLLKSLQVLEVAHAV